MTVVRWCIMVAFPVVRRRRSALLLLLLLPFVKAALHIQIQRVRYQMTFVGNKCQDTFGIVQNVRRRLSFVTSRQRWLDFKCGPQLRRSSGDSGRASRRR